jgi:hypothetical protein
MSEELVFTNTPLENLRSILSDADASVEAAPAQRTPVRETVSKNDVKAMISRLQEDPRRSLSALAIRQAINALTAQPHADALETLLKNRHVADLEQLTRIKS